MNPARTTWLAICVGCCCLWACSSSDPGPARDSGAIDGALADAQADSTPACPNQPGHVAVAEGCLRGAKDGDAWSYLGVPYAAAPLGENRWRPPRAPKPWSGVRAATTSSKACTQIAPLITGKTLESGEDCLYLDVWTPKDARQAPQTLPVMVWIHGGGLSTGSGSQAVSRGRWLAERQNVVVVTINYRLAQLGYLAHPALSAESADGVSGNYGLLDQIAALRWVQTNISAFGGDPANVTIFGESAGGLSVCGLLASPPAKGLFRRAIVQSAACPDFGVYARPLRTATDDSAEAQGLRVAKALGCDDPDHKKTLACLRKKDATAVLEALAAGQGLLDVASERYGFSVDGKVLRFSPAEAIKRGEHHRVPVIIGVTRDEATTFTVTALVTQATFNGYVQLAFGNKADQVKQVYRLDQYPSPKAALTALITDFTFVCPTRRRARQLSAVAPVYLYRFDVTSRPAQQLDLGACHACELEFVFGTLRDRSALFASAEELKASDAMMAYWAQFARGGTPAPTGYPVWPRYDGSDKTDQHLRFEQSTISIASALAPAHCDFLDSL